jgi:DNA-binding CsgD family transcriptional regulator
VAIATLADNLVVESRSARELVLLLRGLGAHAEGDFETAAPMLRSTLALEEGAHDGASAEQPLSLFFAGRAAVHLGDEQAVYRSTHAAATQARAGGALGLLTHVLPRLGYGELWAGRWSAASASAREGLQLARELGQHHLVAHQLALLAIIAAHRGEEDECRSLAAESRELASVYGLVLVADFADWALVSLELGAGEAERALRRARELSTTIVVSWAGLDRIEAATRAGDRETAGLWLASFEPWAVSSAAPWARAVALHCRALFAEDEAEAERLFHRALETHPQAARPFVRARTELALGEFLRRRRRRVEARTHLEAALESFERLGAEPWAEHARVELRASGQTARKRDPSTRGDLTAQELQIARFVAEGLSNRDVAARLFLSPRTIDFHLRNIFRKLEISSRVELARLDLGDEALNTLVASGS